MVSSPSRVATFYPHTVHVAVLIVNLPPMYGGALLPVDEEAGSQAPMPERLLPKLTTSVKLPSVRGAPLGWPVPGTLSSPP